MLRSSSHGMAYLNRPRPTQKASQQILYSHGDAPTSLARGSVPPGLRPAGNAHPLRSAGLGDEVHAGGRRDDSQAVEALQLVLGPRPRALQGYRAEGTQKMGQKLRLRLVHLEPRT